MIAAARALLRGCGWAAAATLVAGSSWALGQGPERVEGGGSFTDAPILRPGTYSDTIRIREKLFYAVELEVGERLRFELEAKGDPAGPSEPTGTLLLNVYNPVRAEYTNNEIQSFTGTNTPTISIKGLRVGSTRDLDDFWAQPGTYYVSVRFYKLLLPNERGPLFKREYPAKVTVEVAGHAVSPSPSPTPTVASPTATVASPTASDDAAETAPRPSDDDSSSYPSFVSVAALAFLVGTIGSFLFTAGRAVARSGR